VVAYKPPDGVVLMIGATFRGASLEACARRLAFPASRDIATLQKYGLEGESPKQLADGAHEIRSLAQDALVKKHDTPLQMADLQDVMARVRGWLVELREVALINLSHDEPSLDRVVSSAPEIADGYPRDLLRELELRLSAARDLKPRLVDAGLDDKMMTRGNKLAQQLRTAIGKEDVDPANLQFKLRRFYMRKGLLYLLAKRVTNAGRYAFRGDPARRNEYHLIELEPDPGSLP
jgi:hypothetical protein